MVIYLGRPLPIASSGSPSPTFLSSCEHADKKVGLDTALHAGKDLAVSPHVLPRGLAQPHFCTPIQRSVSATLSSQYLFATVRVQKWGWALARFRSQASLLAPLPAPLLYPDSQGLSTHPVLAVISLPPQDTKVELGTGVTRYPLDSTGVENTCSDFPPSPTFVLEDIGCSYIPCPREIFLTPSEHKSGAGRPSCRFPLYNSLQSWQ